MHGVSNDLEISYTEIKQNFNISLQINISEYNFSDSIHDSTEIAILLQIALYHMLINEIQLIVN